ncbi:MAG TPA: hypothetical protein VGC99_26255 [Candidatus Tectomicrobia bacterium]
MIQNLPSARPRLRKNAVWEQVVASIPQERENTLLEVALVYHTVGGIEVELRTMIWGDGLGWYRQSTLTLNQASARKLLGALSSVRRRLDPAGAARNDNQDDKKIIPFPDSRTVSTEAEEATVLMA